MSIYRGGLVTHTTPDRMRREVSVDSDPRISTLRPGWLADDSGWRDQLQAMDLTDVRWVERQWNLADGAEAHADTSWLSTELEGRGLAWPLVFVTLALAVLLIVYVLLGVFP